jgi:hypothetical protein
MTVPLQLPFVQASPVVHGSPSLQVPVRLTGAGQPLAGSQAPTVWHWFAGAGQLTGEPPLHTPLWQLSPIVQALPSLQVPLFLATGAGQPEAGLHMPIV